MRVTCIVIVLVFHVIACLTFRLNTGIATDSGRLKRAYKANTLFQVAPAAQKEDAMLLAAWDCGRMDMHSHLVAAYFQSLLATGFLLAILGIIPVRKTDDTKRQVSDKEKSL